MRNKVIHVTMNLKIANTPGVIIVRVYPAPWRKGVLPVLKAVAKDVAGHDVRWKDINIFECLGGWNRELGRVVSGEEEWLGFVERKTQRLYRSDGPGHLERVN